MIVLLRATRAREQPTQAETGGLPALLSARPGPLDMNAMKINELDNWPDSWKVCPEDVAYGKLLIKLMKPFLVELSAAYSSKTVKRHADNLWLLGGYTISLINKNEECRNTLPCLFLSTFIDSFDGPSIHGLTEQEQKSFDCTCRKFYSHLVNNVLIKLVQ
jgi:hypothetical protein